MKNLITKISIVALLLTLCLIFPSTRTEAVPSADGLFGNISTRLQVLTGENVVIAGFRVDQGQQILVRALGPTLANFGLIGLLDDPTIELYDSTPALLASNDNWKDTQLVPIAATGKAPPNDKEAAILRTLSPGTYTAIVRGKNNNAGVGLVEVYGIADPFLNLISNISTRGFVGTGNNVMIGGFIGEATPLSVVVRALGPTLSQFGINDALVDPTLELHDANGNLLAFNDNWQDSPDKTFIQQIGLAPPNSNEAVILTLADFHVNITAIVRGKNNTTGVALVEAYAF